MSLFACPILMHQRPTFVPEQSTLHPMLGVTAHVLNAGDEVSAQSVVEMLIEVAEVHPRFFRRQLNEVVGAMLQVGVCAAHQVVWLLCTLPCGIRLAFC